MKNCSYKLFFSNQFHLSGSRKSFDSKVQLLPKFSSNKIDLNVA